MKATCRLSMMLAILILSGCKKDDDLIMGSFTDTRDDQEYEWVMIGSQTWMAENLNFETEEGSSCYENVRTHCKTYGRLYDWNTAKTACPAGWHMPSDQEWSVLEKELGMSLEDLEKTGDRTSGMLGPKIKSRVGWFFGSAGQNSTGFNARPGGRIDNKGTFEKLSKLTNFWTSTEKTPSGSEVWIRSLSGESDGVTRQTDIKTNGNSLRCLKD